MSLELSLIIIIPIHSSILTLKLLIRGSIKKTIPFHIFNWSKLPSILECRYDNHAGYWIINLQINKRSRLSIDLDIHNTRNPTSDLNDFMFLKLTRFIVKEVFVLNKGLIRMNYESIKNWASLPLNFFNKLSSMDLKHFPLKCCRRKDARFTTEPLKPLSDTLCWKVFNSINSYVVFLQRRIWHTSLLLTWISNS